MAVGANGLVDKEAPLQLGVVVHTERPSKAPALGLDGWLGVARLIGRRRSVVSGKSGAERKRERASEACGACDGTERKLDHSAGSGVRRRGAGCGVAGGVSSSGPSTASVMLPGSASGFSIHPTTGITTRKNKK